MIERRAPDVFGVSWRHGLAQLLPRHPVDPDGRVLARQRLVVGADLDGVSEGCAVRRWLEATCPASVVALRYQDWKVELEKAVSFYV